MVVRLLTSLVVRVTFLDNTFTYLGCASPRSNIRLLIVLVSLSIIFLSITVVFAKFSITMTVY